MSEQTPPQPDPPREPQPPLPPVQPSPVQPPPSQGFKRLTRSSYDSPVSGVCGGVAQYLGVDPTVVRVLAVIAMVVTFPVGPLVYLALWAIIPKQ